MPHIYILELAEGHYFIGRCEDSEDINEKVDDHLLGKTKDPHLTATTSSGWTRSSEISLQKARSRVIWIISRGTDY